MLVMGLKDPQASSTTSVFLSGSSMAIAHSHGAKGRTLVPGTCHYKKRDKKELLLLTCAANKQKIKLQDQIECCIFLPSTPGLSLFT